MASASAYFRLAAKADRAGNDRQAEAWRSHAYRLVNEDRHQREYMARMKETNK